MAYRDSQSTLSALASCSLWRLLKRWDAQRRRGKRQRKPVKWNERLLGKVLMDSDKLHFVKADLPGYTRVLGMRTLRELDYDPERLNVFLAEGQDDIQGSTLVEHPADDIDGLQWILNVFKDIEDA